MSTPVHRFPGRGRRYDLEPDAEAKNPFMAEAIAVLDERAERASDLLRDLTTEQLAFVPSNVYFSIAKVFLHLVTAEEEWMTRVRPHPVPAHLKEVMTYGSIMDGTAPPGTLLHADRLRGVASEYRDTVSRPLLREITDPEQEIADGSKLRTVRQVMHHLTWHWTYHSAHIGLIRLMTGSDYVWTFAEHWADRQPT